MQAPNIKSTADAIVGIWTLALTSFIIAALYFGREILIPIALAALLTFLLSPLVSRLEKWVGRIAAVLLLVTTIFAATAAGAYVLTRQMIDLAAKLPDYKSNIQQKLRAFQTTKGGAFSRFTTTIEELKKDLPGAEPATTPAPFSTAREALGVAPTSSPVPVIATYPENPKTNPLDLAQSLIAPLLGPLGTASLVLLLLVFMLLQREDLRRRVIRLIGQGRISVTTRAMMDAGDRVSRYLLMQLVVNVSFGIPVAIGLHLIGVPNAILWGTVAAVLRFVPYIGPWIAAGFPILLTVASSPGWTPVLLTLALFIVLELLSNNVMEPWLYGSSTGVSPVALIVAAVFWTWIWGPVGLVLATPLTVCLVVMGRHIPRLAFLSVLLSDEEALTPAEDCYHRILTIGEQDELELIEGYLKSNSLTALYDFVFVPVIVLAETDHQLGMLDDEQRTQVEQGLRDFVEDLRPSSALAGGEIAPAVSKTSQRHVLCLPARANRDALAGAMLAQLLAQQGFATQNAEGNLTAGELVQRVETQKVDLVCISVVTPSTVIHARYLCKKVRSAFPQMKIVVGLWGTTEGLTEASKRLRDSGADEVVTTLAEAILRIGVVAQDLPESA